MKDKQMIMTILIGLVLSIGFLIYSNLTSAENISEADQVAIYTAVIHQQYTVDDTFGGSLNAPVTYIINTTNDAIGDPAGDKADPVTLSDSVQHQITANLSDLPTQIVWVNSSSQVPIDTQTGIVEEDGVIITLGNIHPKVDGSVHVPASIYIANLAAGGQTYVLHTSGESWIVKGTTGVQWIS